MRVSGCGVLGMMVIGALALGEAKITMRRVDRDRRATQEAKTLTSPAGVNKSVAEAEAMREFADTRGLGNLGCQYRTETIIILDNSLSIFDKELWMFKLFIKELAAALLNGNPASRIGIILTTQPLVPIVLPGTQGGQSITGIWQTIKGVQRAEVNGDVAVATRTAIGLYGINTCPACTFNLLLLSSPGFDLGKQLVTSAKLLYKFGMIRRYAVGTRITDALLQYSFYAFAGCNGCQNVDFVGECTPLQFLFLIKKFYPLLCAPVYAYREATIMTFQVDNMAVDDQNLPEFVNKFVDVMAQTTGVDRQYLEVIDVRDSNNTAGPQLNQRRLKTVDDIMNYPQDTLLDIVIRESPNGLSDTPFRIADRFDTDLRNELSPVAGLFSKEFGAIPKVRKMSSPRESIFSRQGNGLTFQKLHLNGGELASLSNRAPLSEILQQ